ncbi:MAG: septal ring lytic transglycosylase RlpA family protein [Synergistetes bacterium]|nr:septal ring lytic transglycosylase RlpA family protein [Synergistota bacterium]MCX8127375.1 septal ring lytic transglycosylase RlpA family protein [Synergistota bacterium]MDW8192239.1 septal ring lytic transglycosylase RlpA family protein [Synergistota bacterium]
MNKKVLIALLLLYQFLVAGMVYGSSTFPCWYEVKDKNKVEVRFAGQYVMRLRRGNPERRASEFVNKINSLWERGLLFRDFEIVKGKDGYLIKYNNEEIFKVTEEDARDNGTTPFHLAAIWLNNLCYGMASLQSYRLWSRSISHPRIIEGIASWYGSEWNNRETASGEIYWDKKLIAASRTLPFNSLVKVTDLKTGRWVVVRIVDRGPYVRGRIIDLSTAAAEVLEMKGRGIAQVRVEVIQWDDRFGGKR